MAIWYTTLAAMHFEWGTLDEIETLSSPTIATIAQTGTYSIRCNGVNNFYKTVPDVKRFRMGFHIRHNGTENSDEPYVVMCSNDTGVVWAVTYNEDAELLRLYVNGVLRDTINSPLFNELNTWRFMGIDADIHTDGYVKVYLNGYKVLGYSGDVTNGEETVNRFHFGGRTNNEWAMYAYWDNIYIDAINIHRIALPPPVKEFELLTVNGDSGTPQWTNSSGSPDNYTNLNNVPIDENTLVETLVLGSEDVYTLTSKTHVEREPYFYPGMTNPPDYQLNGGFVQGVARKLNASKDTRLQVKLDDEASVSHFLQSDPAVFSFRFEFEEEPSTVTLVSAGDFGDD